MGLEPVGLPDPPDLAVMQPHPLGHQTRAPVRPAGRLLPKRAAHDLGLKFGCDSAPRPTGAGSVLKSREPVLVIAVQPSLHRGERDADLAGQSPP